MCKTWKFIDQCLCLKNGCRIIAHLFGAICTFAAGPFEDGHSIKKAEGLQIFSSIVIFPWASIHFFCLPNNSIRQPVCPADPREGSRAEWIRSGKGKADWPVNLVVTSTRLPAGIEWNNGLTIGEGIEEQVHFGPTTFGFGLAEKNINFVANRQWDWIKTMGSGIGKECWRRIGAVSIV